MHSNTLVPKKYGILQKRILLSILALSIIALIASSAIEYQETHKRSNLLDSICMSTQAGNSCADVQNSAYSQIFGIKLPIIGIVGFFALFALTASELYKKRRWQKRLILSGAVIAGIGGASFILVQALLIGEFCTYCLIVDTSGIIILLLAAASIYLQRTSKIISHSKTKRRARR